MPKSAKSISSPAYAQFRSMLIDARTRAGVPQAEIARRLEKPQSYVSKYETGERRLDVLEFIRVAQALGIDPLKVMKKLVGVTGETVAQSAKATG